MTTNLLPETRVPSKVTKPHWDSEQSYDYQRWSSGQIILMGFGPHDEVSPDGSKNNHRLCAAAVINRNFQNDETTCHHLSKKTPRQEHHLCCWGYSDHFVTRLLSAHGPCTAGYCGLLYVSMPYSQVIENKDAKNPLICHIMNTIWMIRAQVSVSAGSKPFWHWCSWCSRPANKRPSKLTGQCSLSRFEAISQPLSNRDILKSSGM